MAAVCGAGATERQSAARRDRARRSRPRPGADRRGDPAPRAGHLVVYDLCQRPRGADRSGAPGRPRAAAARADGGGRPAREPRPARALHLAVARRDPRSAALGARPLRRLCRHQQPYGQQIHRGSVGNGAGHRGTARPRSRLSQFADDGQERRVRLWRRPTVYRTPRATCSSTTISPRLRSPASSAKSKEWPAGAVAPSPSGMPTTRPWQRYGHGCRVWRVRASSSYRSAP